MALKLIHLLAARFENGLQVLWSDNHVFRDEDYESLLAEWDHPTQPAPLKRADIFVPFEATHQQIHEYIRDNIQKATMRLEVKALMDFVQHVIEDDDDVSPTHH